MVEEGQDHLAEVEEDQDHPVEVEEDQDPLLEANWLHINQYHLQQMLRRWEVFHKYSMETDPKLTTSSKKSKDISISMPMSPDTIHHTRR